MNINTIVSPRDGKRLNRCLKWLTRACDAWTANGMIDGPLLIAVATTKAAQVIRAEQWPPLIEGEYEAGEVAQAVIAATETGKVDVAVAGVSLLLGEAGRAAHLEDVVEIRKEGQIPMLLFLIADTKTYLASTTGVPRPVLN